MKDLLFFVIKNKNFWQAVIAAITAFITALTTTSCTGYGPFPFHIF